MRSFDEIASVLISRLGSRGAETLFDVPGRRTRSRSPGNSMLYRHGSGGYSVSGWLAAHCLHGAPRPALLGYVHADRLFSGNAGCADGYATSPDREQDRGDHRLVVCFFFCVFGTGSFFNRCQAVCQTDGPIRSFVPFSNGLISQHAKTGSWIQELTKVKCCTSRRSISVEQTAASRSHKLGPMKKSRFDESVLTYWCERGDSNPHGFTRQILSLVRLPIPPLSLVPPMGTTWNYKSFADGVGTFSRRSFPFWGQLGQDNLGTGQAGRSRIFILSDSQETSRFPGSCN
jgi:hypothetical protein